MFDRAADHDATIRSRLRHNFSQVVLADRRQAQMDYRQRVRLKHAKTICMAKTIDVVQRATHARRPTQSTHKTTYTAETTDALGLAITCSGFDGDLLC